ncbi:hypothetical protein PV379_33800, partial [Streptomyces caniscabiei]|nr:hypothetical protein [Streptomyces caniscabiei]
MSTTTSHTPEPEGAARPARLIQNETTTEIPVHLLFRDDPAPVSVPVTPAVVGRRRGTGEQPRVRQGPASMKPRPAVEVDPELVERLDGWPRQHPRPPGGQHASGHPA